MTEAQKRVYDYLVQYTTEHLYPPTLDEIAFDLNKGKSVVLGHLLALEAKGYIEREHASSRTIKLVGYKLVKE